ncbi:MAG: peptidoglycan DD-metalloendopeptidase family protein [Stigonema ocellatum SAG 48.90 = DSM 106950]|nr:peptidoglycan DD-metalloendopeptidase family protein [Stigonema ocellatum SAG 48.90 = DSM 106950]
MKRALKKREKAVLETTPSDYAPVEQLNVVHPRVNRRVPTKAAMIGLAISMGATSFLVTRQSDQALAAEPVANQNTASTIPAASDTEVKFAPTKSQESQSVSSVSVPENHAIVEPTAISQVSGLGAKWRQVAATGEVSVPVSAPAGIKRNPNQAKTDLQRFHRLTQIVQRLSSTHGVAGSPGKSTSLITQPQTVSSEVNAQLKAQQEFALNSLQEKSNRLRKSLAQLRSRQTKDLSQAATPLAQPMTIAQTSPQTTEQLGTFTNASKARLVAKLKQRSQEKVAAPMPATSALVAPSALIANEVKPGDTLADIASNYGTSVSELLKANSLANPNQLPISQKLTVPATENRSTANNTSGTAKIASTSANSVIANNSSATVSVPTPVNTHGAVAESSPANSLLASTPTQPETVSSAATPYGMGGDTPIPQAIMDMQATTRETDRAKTKLKQNPRLHSLQAEIDRLREKYRAQQSGTPLAPEVPQTNTASQPIPVFQPNNQAVSIPVSRPNNQAVPIAVPRPMELNYGAQPVRPQVRDNGTNDDDAVNPEFLPNRPTNVATPRGYVDASQSLGHLRGTTVSPNLPPLAAVDRYLPRPIDETTTIAAGYIWPAKGVLTSGFGMRWGRMHKGIDVANSTGTPIYASADGVVEKAGWNNGGYGNLVDIRHADGSITRYGHNSKILVHPGQQVHQGDIIAAMGSTGFSTGPHSHFEVHPGGKGAVNPIAFLPRI